MFLIEIGLYFMSVFGSTSEKKADSTAASRFWYASIQQLFLANSVDSVCTRSGCSFFWYMQSEHRMRSNGPWAATDLGIPIVPHINSSTCTFPGTRFNSRDVFKIALAFLLKFSLVRLRHSFRSVKTTSIPRAHNAIPATGDAPQPSSIAQNLPVFFANLRITYSARMFSAYHNVPPVPTDLLPNRSYCARSRTSGIPIKRTAVLLLYSVFDIASMRFELENSG
mmetsp:Transcript_30566/g.42555  ORF Transcript_30566/g.42555 Transcript_30566/m.42555 type:complete len:224 (+) Transcript_30566:354-1025(+)